MWLSAADTAGRVSTVNRPLTAYVHTSTRSCGLLLADGSPKIRVRASTYIIFVTEQTKVLTTAEVHRARLQQQQQKDERGEREENGGDGG